MKTNPVRDWELERFLLGELPNTRIQEIEKELEKDLNLQARVAVLKRSNTEILQQHPPEAVIPGIQQGVRAEKTRRNAQPRPIFTRRLLYAAPVFVAAVVILLVVLQNPDRTSDPASPFGTRIKGTEKIDRTKPHLLVYKKKAGDVELLEDGDRAKPGDLLQIAYGAAGLSYGVILSIDGNGAVTLHYPERETDSAMLGDQKVVLLSSAYELDKAPGFERFFFITSAFEIDVRHILDIASTLAGKPEEAQGRKLSLPATYSQFTVLLKKGDLP